jgi:hypothetical protein
MRYLKHFFEFSKRGPKALSKATFGPGGDFESPLAAAVARELRQRGWLVHPQVGVSSFLQALYAEGLSRKTFARYRDHLWLLGGTIIRKVSLYKEYQDDPLEKLRESIADGGTLPDHYDQMTQAELKAFERICRRFEKYLGESK